MPTSVADLLPETFGTPTVTPPATILRQAASLLGERTNHLVEGEVALLSIEKVASLKNSLESAFCYDFNLKALALSNYRFRLFSIEYRSDFYPVNVSGDVLVDIRQELSEDSDLDFIQTDWTMISSNVYQCKSEEEFMTLLRYIFRSERVERIIGAIMAQSER